MDAGRLPGRPVDILCMTALARERGAPIVTLNSAISGSILRAGVLLLVTLLLTPLAVQAQGITDLYVYQSDGLHVRARVTLTGSASHYPATVTVTWGDGASNYSIASNTGDYVKTLWHTYANCGVRSIGVSVSFNGGGSASRSRDFTVACEPAQPPVGSPIHCFVDGCRHVPDYFIENDLAHNRWLEDALKRRERGDYSVRPLSDFGYRCPDAMGRCPTGWILGTGNTRGLSGPNSFISSSVTNVPGANIQRIDADGIGVKWIVDQRPIDAVDVWGAGAEGGGEVCFLGTEGRLIYLDARTSPRAQSELSTTVKGDQICGTMPGPGSVVYLPPEG